MRVLYEGASFVTCVEAEETNAKVLQMNLDLNKFLPKKACVVRALVLGSDSGPRHLRVSEKSTRHATDGLFVVRPSDSLQEVPVTTLPIAN